MALKRRSFLGWLAAAGGIMGFRTAQAHHTETHFEDKSEHMVVYQCNEADPHYWESILFSAGEILRKYGDNAEIVISCFGPGLQILAKRPNRPVPAVVQERVASLADYGVSFHACGNTLKSLKWTEADLVDFAVHVPIGADDIMLLQEQGFAYIRW